HAFATDRSDLDHGPVAEDRQLGTKTAAGKVHMFDWLSRLVEDLLEPCGHSFEAGKNARVLRGGERCEQQIRIRASIVATRTGRRDLPGFHRHCDETTAPS